MKTKKLLPVLLTTLLISNTTIPVLAIEPQSTGTTRLNLTIDINNDTNTINPETLDVTIIDTTTRNTVITETPDTTDNPAKLNFTNWETKLLGLLIIVYLVWFLYTGFNCIRWA